MTLNITVTSVKRIYQCADFRFTDTQTKESTDDALQKKIQLVQTSAWHATVCFNGVGNWGDVDVTKWLANQLSRIELNDPMARLFELLSEADRWLETIPHPDNRHSFIVGAFEGSRPVYALMTNYEEISGRCSPVANKRLQLIQGWPKSPKTFVSGAVDAVSLESRVRLANLAASSKDPGLVISMLAAVNKEAAKKYNTVSESCFTNFIERTGGGSSIAHGILIPVDAPNVGNPFMERAIQEIVRKQFPDGAYLKGSAVQRFGASEDFHQSQITDHPLDASNHSNYGVFLFESKKDRSRAEQEYRKALELDPNHVNALCNLANLFVGENKFAEAAELYRRALANAPADENANWNYANFLEVNKNDYTQAREQLVRSLVANPTSARTYLSLSNLDLVAGDAEGALAMLRQARENGGDQKSVQGNYAIARHVKGAPIGECIAAYHTALSLDPKDPALNLNLAQLLFLSGDYAEAQRRLRLSINGGLDHSANLEAQFYRLAHSNDDVSDAVRSIRASLASGGRLKWNLNANIEKAGMRDEALRRLLKSAQSIISKQEADSFDVLIRHWPSRRVN